MTTSDDGEHAVMQRLRGLWERRDPVPPDLARRVTAALAGLSIDEEYRQLVLLSRGPALAGTRAVAITEIPPVRMEFADADVSLLVRVAEAPHGARRMDGWIVPAGHYEVALRQGSRSWTRQTDEAGRFVFEAIPAGSTTLRFIATERDVERPFGTTVFDI